MELLGKSISSKDDQTDTFGSRVLLVGASEQEFQGRLEEALTKLHCSFAHAAGVVDALGQLRETPYAVVITDPNASVHDDLALVDEISQIRPQTRVIILAPDGTPGEMFSALRHRVFLYKIAPFDPGEVARNAVSAIEAGDECLGGLEVLSADRNWISVRMNCHLLNADRLISFFDQMKLPERPPEELMIAFREILNNAIEHGAQNDPSKSIQVSAVRTARSFVFHVADPGKGFRRDAVPHAAFSNTPAQPIRHIEIRESLGMRPGGYGILTARGIIDEMIFNEIGNEVLLIKYMSDPPRDRTIT